MKFELMQDHFIEPQIVRAGVVIDMKTEEFASLRGIPTPAMRPMDEEAEEAMKAYFTKNPGASINPVMNLSRTVGGDK